MQIWILSTNLNYFCNYERVSQEVYIDLYRPTLKYRVELEKRL